MILTIMKNKELNIVIPVYNESEIIKDVTDSWIVALNKIGIDFEINLYNDGSKDNSAEILDAIEAENACVNVIHKENSGHGPTILMGYMNSKDNEWVFQIDSDGEMKPDKFVELWNNRNKYDFLLGTRFNRQSPISRKIITFVARRTIGLLFNNGISDVNSPYRLMRVSKVYSFFEKIPTDTFAPNIVLSGLVTQNKLRVYETPVEFTFRQTGEVSIKHFKLFKVALKSFFSGVEI